MKFSHRAWVAVLAVTGLALVYIAADFARAEPASTTKPDIAAGPATQPARISSDAQLLLSQMRKGYATIKGLKVDGTVKGEFDIDGEQHAEQAQFVGTFDSAKGLFRNEVTGDALLGNTGRKMFLFLPSKNSYVQFDLPAEHLTLESIDEDVADILRKQDMSVALALSSDAAREISDGAMTISKIEDTQIDGVAYPTLLLTEKDLDLTLVLDPATHLLRREIADLTKVTKSRGARIVKTALLTSDFKNTLSEAIGADQFAWTPPPGAQEMKGSGDNSALVGKPAPSFALEDLNGKKVSSADLKGQVYVLDFWATWCGPCVMSLPGLDTLYKSHKDAGLKVFALNQQEDKEVVQKFEDEKKFSLTILLDADAKVGEAFGVLGIPQTVVVGKDGRVLKVFIGAMNEDPIRQAVDAALKQ
ncbi:MAG: redoxin family protein [Planctomycetota bacterium]|nr:redoxin family protein [Planctomycetota bacterium]